MGQEKDQIVPCLVCHETKSRWDNMGQKSNFMGQTLRGRLVRWNPWESGGIGIQFPGIPMFGWFLRMELESGGGNEFHQMREFRILQHMEGIQIP